MRLLPRSFRNLLVVVFGLLMLLVGLPLQFYSSDIHRQQLVADRQEYLQSLATATAAVLAENLVERRRDISLLAQTAAFRIDPLNGHKIVAGLDRLKRSYPHYSWIGLADTSGRIRAATSQRLIGADVSERPWFVHGREAPYIGDLHEAKLLAKILAAEYPDQLIRFIDFASPVYDDAGKLRGVLAAHAHWQWAGAVLSTLVPENAEREQIEVFIVGRDNHILYPEAGYDGLQAPPVTAMGDGKFVDWGSGRTFLTATQAVTEPAGDLLGWRMVVRQPREIVLDDVSKLQGVFLYSFLLAGIGFLIFAWLIATRISRPLAQLTEIARRVERGDNTVDFAVQASSKELRSLAQALGGMAQTLIEQKAALLAANRELEDKVAERTAELSRLNADLQSLARTDALTGLANRMHANERLAEEFGRYRRTGSAYALLVMDIDHFKRVNDTWGHPTGDLVLSHVAGLLRAQLRATDFIARIGGEEFLVILPATGLDQAVSVAEKLRGAVESALVEPVGQVTLSIGVHAPTPADTDEDQALHDADQRLYAAKSGGRNRVVWQLAGETARHP